MSAKRHLHILLVAFLIVLLFALIPASAETEQLEILDIEHYNIRDTNSIQVKVNNYEDGTINCNLILSIYSKDLTEDIPASDSITFFSIEESQNYTHIFEFKIPLSGDFFFNFSLLTEDNDFITQQYKIEKFTFYDYKEYQIESIIVDNYYDPKDNANWIYDSEEDTLELHSIEDSFDTGIVLGPFETTNLITSKIKMEYQHEKSLNSNYSILMTTNFNSSEIYGTEWEHLHHVEEETDISLEIPNNSVVFILLQGQDTSAISENFWRISSVSLEKLTVKHSLSSYIQPTYFFGIDDKQEIIVETTNTGNFDQQLGNISILTEIYDESGVVESQADVTSIGAGENQNIKVTFNEKLDPGHYYMKLKTTIIDETIFFNEKISFVSISNNNYGDFDLNLSDNNQIFSFESQNDRIELLVKSSMIDNLNISTEVSINELTKDHYLINIDNAQKEIHFSTSTTFNGEILSIINLDEVKYSVDYDETSIITVEGITAPAIIFEDGNTEVIVIRINNEGFYTETYDLNYIYSSTFISNLEGIGSVQVQPNSFENVEIKIDPLKSIPREGGSQFNIEISNNNEDRLITYVFSYLTPEIEITEIKCDRYAALIGQEIKCTTILTNKGYYTDDLIFLIYSEEIIIDQVRIDALDYLETWTLTTTYEPKNIGEEDIIVNAITNDGTIFEDNIKSKIKVIEAENLENEETNQMNMPEINAERSLLLLGIAGILYQIKRSENLKYLGLKFFFVPLYSRLQKDTLTDEPTRQKLLKYIYSEPGANFKQLKDKFSLHNGTLAHHINILENHDIITSHRSGRQRLFFPMGVNQEISRVSLVTNETQRNIMDIVKDTPGITQAMISKQLGMSRQKVNYHVNSLVDKAFLKIEKQGRITRLYPLYYT